MSEHTATALAVAALALAVIGIVAAAFYGAHLDHDEDGHDSYAAHRATRGPRWWQL